MRLKLAISLVLIVSLIAGLAYFGILGRTQDLMKAGAEKMAQMGPWAPVLFIVLYVFACVALVPAAMLTLAGGAVFGLFWGVVYVVIGASLGATAAFLIGRFLARDWVTARLGDNPMLAAVQEATERDGWKIVFLTRLAPIFPFFLLNYAYGLTRVPLKHYLPATCLGIIPGTILFTYIGTLANSHGTEASPSQWIGRGFVLVTAALAVACLGRIARKALNKKTHE